MLVPFNKDTEKLLKFANDNLFKNLDGLSDRLARRFPGKQTQITLLGEGRVKLIVGDLCVEITVN